MTSFFNLLTHAVILTGLLGLSYLILHAIRSTAELSERLVLTAAVMTGFLIYFGARALGISIPELLLPAVADPNPYKVGLIGTLTPAAVGVLVSWHGLRCLRKGVATSWRFLLLGTALVVTLFGDVYAATFSVNFIKNGIDGALLPNLAFQIGMTLHLIFNYPVQIPSSAEHASPSAAHSGLKRFRSGTFASGGNMPIGN